MREATARTLGANLPMAGFVTVEKQSGAYLDQEIKRAGRQADFVVIDLPGADSALCRYALAMADTIVTPVGTSVYDLGGLGRVSPITETFIEGGPFGNLVREICQERAKLGQIAADWIVMKNRSRPGEKRLAASVDASLDLMSRHLGFRVGVGLYESISFRDLNAYGLTYLDIRLISALGKRNYQSEAAIIKFLTQLQLPGFAKGAVPATHLRNRVSQVSKNAPVSEGQVEKYEQVLRDHKRSH